MKSSVKSSRLLVIFCLFPCLALGQIKCTESKTQLFASNVTLELKITVNMSQIVEEVSRTFGRPQKQFPGVLEYTSDHTGWKKVPVVAIPRGGVRSWCEFPPLKFIFDKETSYHKNLSNAEILLSLEKKISLSKNDFQGFKQKNNIFQKLGKKVRLVTHCGEIEFDSVSGVSLFEQEQRLLLEYYLYKILEPLETTTYKTRLARIIYLNIDGSKKIKTYSFFRESKKDVAKRCGMFVADSGEDTIESTYSKIQLEYLEYLVANSDYNSSILHENERGEDIILGHNVSRLNRDNTIFFAPYDFDQTALFGDIVYDSSIPYFPRNMDIAQRVVKKLLEKKSIMLKIASDSLLSKKYKTRLVEHIEETMSSLKRMYFEQN